MAASAWLSLHGKKAIAGLKSGKASDLLKPIVLMVPSLEDG
jgi:hypothetical protein